MIKFVISISEMSADLVTQLQERDALILQGDTMRVTVGKLVSLQANVKNASTLNSTRGLKRLSQAGSITL